MGGCEDARHETVHGQLALQGIALCGHMCRTHAHWESRLALECPLPPAI